MTQRDERPKTLTHEGGGGTISDHTRDTSAPTPPQPRPDVARLAAYALADLDLPEDLSPVQLAQNESPYPPSPEAGPAVLEALAKGHLYPDPDWTDLRAAIADVHGIDPDLALCGSGSMELIGGLIRAYAGPGDEVLAPQHAYGFFRTATAIAGAKFVTAPETALTLSVDALLAATTPRTKMVCVANPGNPTGTWVPFDEIRRLREHLPGHVLLLLDEAYGEFAPDARLPAGLVERGDTVITRTFSKAYGLAGMRVGWALMPGEAGREVRKLLNPNNVSIAAQAAAGAAMRDQRYMQETVAKIAAARDRFATRLQAIGLETAASHANFVLIRFANPDEANRAERALRANGVLTRPQAGHGLPDCLRITIGLGADMDLTADTLQAWTDGGRP